MDNSTSIVDSLRQQLLDALIQKASGEGARIADAYTKELQLREQELSNLPPLVRERILNQHMANYAQSLSQTLSKNKSDFLSAAKTLSKITASGTTAGKAGAKTKKLSATEINMGPYVQFRGEYPDSYLKWLFEKSIENQQSLDPSAYYSEWRKGRAKKTAVSDMLAGQPSLAGQDEIQKDIEQLRKEGYSENDIAKSLSDMGLKPEDYGIQPKSNWIPDWVPILGRF